MLKPLKFQHKIIPKSSLQFFAEDKYECRQDQLKSANDLDDTCLADKASNPKKRRVTNEDVLQMQYDCLSLQRENLLLKEKKLTLQVQLLEQQVQVTLYSKRLLLCRCD